MPLLLVASSSYSVQFVCLNNSTVVGELYTAKDGAGGGRRRWRLRACRILTQLFVVEPSNVRSE